MKLFLLGHALRYEAGNLCMLFFPGEPIEEESGLSRRGDFYAVTRIRRGRRMAVAMVLLRRGGKTARAHARFDPNDCITGEPLRADLAGKAAERALGRAFVAAGQALTGTRPPWGMLTGIRPVKLARETMAAGRSEAQARDIFTRELLVSEEKTNLCFTTARAETRITGLSQPRSVSLYISVPFCPTRCLYCSFISHDVEKAKKLLPAYADTLCREIAAVGALIRRLGLRLETVYMGGGTPTTLSAAQLAQVFAALREALDWSTVRECTVEAGRPDTITPGKLAAIRAGGCTRLCVNPQTLEDDVLRRIGRAHTAAQFFGAFAMARAAGFDSVNTDLIAGLPGDTPAGFRRTLARLLPLSPEGVTVHTLAMKRSSRLVETGAADYDARGRAASKMVRDAYAALTGAGLAPYYLYRQRNTAGNLENTGFAKPGHEGLYNVFMMDETHTVLGAGAGAVSKFRQPGGSRIERVFNFKYPYEYLARFDEVLARKRDIEAFYAAWG